MSGHITLTRALLVVLMLGLGACGSSSKSGTGSGGHDGGAGAAAGRGGSSGGGGGVGTGGADGGGVDTMTTPEDAASASDGEASDGASGTKKDGPCIKIFCQQAGGQYCGSFPDGCGGVAVCGDCPKGQVCGSADAGINHVCGGDPNCKPIACSGPGYQFCGTIGDGCNHSLNCGDCTAPKTCGGGGTKNVCGP